MKASACSAIYRLAECVLTLMGCMAACAAAADVAPQQPLVLRYYMHYFLGDNIVELVAPPGSDGDPSVIGFGLLTAMNLPLTTGPDPATSIPLGAERCLVTTVAYSSAYIGNLHVCSITYNDGVHDGIFNLQGESNVANLERGWEFAVTGGSGDFRGATGHAIGYSLPNYGNATHDVYYYVIHIYLPNPAPVPLPTLESLLPELYSG